MCFFLDQKIESFCKAHYGAERTSFKPRHNRGKIPTESFRCYRAPFKVVEKVGRYQNASDNTMPVPVEDHFKLIEQTALLLRQLLNLILCNRRLQTLKTLMNYSKKVTNILKENTDLLQKK